jgi:hypothetical protein
MAVRTPGAVLGVGHGREDNNRVVLGVGLLHIRAQDQASIALKRRTEPLSLRAQGRSLDCIEAPDMKY